jgi:hypothetical protein
MQPSTVFGFFLERSAQGKQGSIAPHRANQLDPASRSAGPMRQHNNRQSRHADRRRVAENPRARRGVIHARSN